MENASKALTIAGSVFLAILIITVLVITFRKIGTWKQTEANTEGEQTIIQYNKEIESFNKAGLYGSEILSLANLIDDYNTRQADQKGYKAINLTIYIEQINDAKYIKKNYTNYKNLINDFKKLETQVNTLQNTKICGESLKKLAGLTTENLRDYINKYNALNSKSYTYEQVEQEIEKYQALNSEMQVFKNKRFKLPEVKYDKLTGRVISMMFKEVGI